MSISLIAAIISCAEIGSPPGGEEDRSGPFLIGSMPANEAVGVDPGPRIVVYFSEPIQKPSQGAPVFVSPRQAKTPELKWMKDHLIIDLAEEFAPDQTYIVTIRSSLTDWRNNSLDSAATIAFSTGESIDSGSIAGYLTDQGRPASGGVVALYDLEQELDAVAYDSIFPDYLATSNSLGRFEFRYLPERSFRMVAFQDKDRNERLNPYRERFAVPDREIVVGGELPLDALNLLLTSVDTLSPVVLSATQTSNNLVRIRLSKAISLDQLNRNPADLSLIPDDSAAPILRGEGILETDLPQSDIVTANLDLRSEGTYRLELAYDSMVAPLVYEGLEIRDAMDKEPPAIVRFSPENKAHFLQQVEMRICFSEPLDTSQITEQTFILRQSDSRVSVARNWTDRFHLELEPEGISPGLEYQLDITEFDLIDLAGNLLGDSLSQFRFSVIGDDSLGWIAGEVVVSLEDKQHDSLVLSFVNSASGQLFDLPAVAGQFKMALPAGKYILSGFVDSDGDGKQGYGSLLPYGPAETYIQYPDSISVRARFETAGITLEFR